MEKEYVKDRAMEMETHRRPRENVGNKGRKRQGGREGREGGTDTVSQERAGEMGEARHDMSTKTTPIEPLPAGCRARGNKSV